MDTRAELNKEIRRARGWLIAVGIIMFVMDMILIHAVYGDQLTDDWKNRIMALSGGIMAVFFALAFFTSRKPKLCLILGLVVFWGLQLYNAAIDPSTLTQGIVLKIFFTVALVKGLKSATRAEDLRAELERVFE